MLRPQRKRSKKRHGGSKRSVAPKKPAGRVVLSNGIEDMSNRVRRDLKVLKQIMVEHSRTVEQKLSKNGRAPRALVASAAKYYPTLKKLAEK